MKTVTVDARPLTDTLGDFTRAWKSGKASAPRGARHQSRAWRRDRIA
jgi:hypothetical protein